MNDQMLTTGEAATMLRVHPKTLQRWDRSGQLKALRSPSGRRLYSLSSVLNIINAPLAGVEHSNDGLELSKIVQRFSDVLCALQEYHKALLR